MQEEEEEEEQHAEAVKEKTPKNRAVSLSYANGVLNLPSMKHKQMLQMKFLDFIQVFRIELIGPQFNDSC